MAPGIKTNQGESAKPLIVRYNIGDEDIKLFSESDQDVFTEAPCSANYRFLPHKQAEVFPRTPEKCQHAHQIFQIYFLRGLKI